MNKWHHAAKEPKFLFIFDWKISFIFLFLLFHFRIWVLATLIIFAVILSVLNRFGYSLSVFYKKARSKLAGDVRVSRPFWWNNRFFR